MSTAADLPSNGNTTAQPHLHHQEPQTSPEYSDSSLKVTDTSRGKKLLVQTVTLGFGIGFLAIGVLGFIPGITSHSQWQLGTTSNSIGVNTVASNMSYLFHLFMVSPVHNIIHLVSGLIALMVSTRSAWSLWFLRVLGVVYAIVAIIGFITGTFLGWFSINAWDNVLHTVIAIIALGFGLLRPTVRKRVGSTRA